ncbi:DUF4006 family protein [Helicobacter pametensis]|uniref:DUF4006 family protein n=1 Tax=Helicobacter pametensis TaxID=95149 RepID=UPI00048A2A49|nr:DUF4006 family protein [Helicobacter pametensis]
MNKLFGLNGILGLLILVAVLLSVVFGLGMQAWKTQKIQATNAYSLDHQSIQAIDSKNSQYYKLAK